MKLYVVLAAVFASIFLAQTAYGAEATKPNPLDAPITIGQPFVMRADACDTEKEMEGVASALFKGHDFYVHVMDLLATMKNVRGEAICTFGDIGPIIALNLVKVYKPVKDLGMLKILRVKYPDDPNIFFVITFREVGGEPT